MSRLSPKSNFCVQDVVDSCSNLGTPREPLYYFHNPEVIIPSALVVPVVEVKGVASLVLTKRPETMKNHAGDWVFPGGRIDDGVDASPQEAALRELAEELGVPRNSARVIGELDQRGPTLQGHTINVFVAVIDSVESIHPDPHEVSEVAVVSLAELARPETHYTSNKVPYGYGTNEDTGEPHQVPFDMQFFKFGEGQLIWGTQGEILWDLLACLLQDRQTIAQIRS